jgi:uncharacterized Zn ribbon protein
VKETYKKCAICGLAQLPMMMYTVPDDDGNKMICDRCYEEWKIENEIEEEEEWQE